MYYATCQQAQRQGFVLNFVAGSNGTLSGTPVQTIYKSSSSSAVTAIPNDHYHFVNWTKGGVAYSTNNPLTVTSFTGDMTLTANFTIDTYTVTFIAGVNGTIDGDTEQVVGYGGSCSAVTAAPGSNYHFTGWTGDYGGATNPLTITNVTANMTITANFAIDTHSVTFNVAVTANHGYLSGQTTQSVPYGGNCTSVTAIPSEGYNFVDWKIGGTHYSSSASIAPSNITDNVTYTAYFN
jgi:uncharacterized repeat protein (TIGR02543 family)